MKRISYIIVAMLLLCSSFSFAEDEYDNSEVGYFYARGKVMEVLSDLQNTDENNTGQLNIDKQVIKIRVTSGKYKNEEYIIENHVSGNPVFDIIVKEGDNVILDIEEDENGVPEISVADFARDKYSALLLFVFIGLLILIGKMKGVKSVISLTITGAVVMKLMLPMILKGFNPIWVAILSATIITSVTFIIIAGINIKSFSAIIGTIGGVVSAGILAYIVGSLVKLTGLSSEEASMLMFIPQQINFDYRGLLFAGIIIGTLGAVMDIGMSIASAMYEMKNLNPEMPPSKLIASGLNIGRDVMGTMSNTLILAYTGSSVPLLLLFMAYDTPLIKILNLDMIATEIVRALVGSIGLIVAIPITAMATGLILKYEHIFPKFKKQSNEEQKN
ncbi:YibE/F family protein [Proteiniborus sp. MB09-C3]|uniref:YibE/F family protein n=1 Tax=Proteiniborus sp. MB09-C3 TaxID=3050072 RepID=UPI002552F3EE|nr:YibE/F family protein [Proteiniborus sp. MB09-C3]WIV11306.1 YibE/F family protein [Proteiniborus sp. MB09-C3]